LRKRWGGGEKLGEEGFLGVNSAFLFEGGGELGLDFIYSFFVTFVLCKFLLFFLTFEGGRVHGFFFTFFFKILERGKGVGTWVFIFFTFCYSFIIWKLFVIFCLFLKGKEGVRFFSFFSILELGKWVWVLLFHLLFFFKTLDGGRGA